ncbi:hypothetical protein [Embleya sp. NBC_00896]|uniref:hypothetical protein n=1 Tax=Embleya sp. NBC_00896 TaxID=2975961 RepID=UPI00386C5427|nr:hypothetical protein OG928_36750 [Embleya sp. NBC_00896]
MVASSMTELRLSLEEEAQVLAERRDLLQEELAEVERQLEARRNAVEHLALIRPLVPLPRPEAEPVAPVEDVAPVEPAAEAEPVAETETVAEIEPVAEVEPAPAVETTAATTRPARKKRQPKPASGEQEGIAATPARKTPAAKKPAKKTARAKASRVAKAAAEPVPMPAPEPVAESAPERPVRTHLRDEIAALLEATGEPMNVRQLTEALGEIATKSRMESVRTSTEGLVKAGRATKTGRGLFTGPTA